VSGLTCVRVAGVEALSVIDNLLVVTVFPLYFLPTFVDYTGLYRDYTLLSTFHQYVLVYVLPVAFVAQTATIWVTVLVAINRYIAVCRPYQVLAIVILSVRPSVRSLVPVSSNLGRNYASDCITSISCGLVAQQVVISVIFFAF